MQATNKFNNTADILEITDRSCTGQPNFINPAGRKKKTGEENCAI